MKIKFGLRVSLLDSGEQPIKRGRRIETRRKMAAELR